MGITNQIFHGIQNQNLSKNDLLIAKRESRALRRAKNLQIKNGKFEDAFIQKALENCQNRILEENISEVLDILLNKFVGKKTPKS